MRHQQSQGIHLCDISLACGLISPSAYFSYILTAIVSNNTDNIGRNVCEGGVQRPVMKQTYFEIHFGNTCLLSYNLLVELLGILCKVKKNTLGRSHVLLPVT